MTPTKLRPIGTDTAAWPPAQLDALAVLAQAAGFRLLPISECSRMLNRVRQARDQVPRFLAEHVCRQPGRRVGSAEMYFAYCEWARACGEASVSQNMFGRTLASHAYVSSKSGVKWWIDVELRGAPFRAVAP